MRISPLKLHTWLSYIDHIAAPTSCTFVCVCILLKKVNYRLSEIRDELIQQNKKNKNKLEMNSNCHTLWDEIRNIYISFFIFSKKIYISFFISIFICNSTLYSACVYIYWICVYIHRSSARIFHLKFNLCPKIKLIFCCFAAVKVLCVIKKLRFYAFKIPNHLMRRTKEIVLYLVKKRK